VSKGKDWDWGSNSSLQAAAAWALKKAGDGALVVVIVRVDDLAIAGDPKLAPRDVMNLLEHRAPELSARLQDLRQAEIAKNDKRLAKGVQ
jgi:hypothetical protein